MGEGGSYQAAKGGNFAESLGLTSLVNVNIENCLEYFQLIISDVLLGKVVEETNRYADQFYQNPEYCQNIPEPKL